MESCLDCVRKHLAAAMCYLTESRLGYPERIWRCIGEMRLAEDESAEDYPAFAMTIRAERMRYLTHACDSRYVELEAGRVIYPVFPEKCEIQKLIDSATTICVIERKAPIPIRKE